MLRIDSQYHLPLGEELATPLAGADLQVLSVSDQHLLVAPREASSLALAGQIGPTALEDVLSFLQMFRKTGGLHVVTPKGERLIFFETGEVVYAMSTHPGEDAGSYLIAKEELAEGVWLQLTKEVLGQPRQEAALVSRNLVDKDHLWTACRHKVETIVYALFAETAGSFYFLADERNQGQTFGLSTQNLIMEGLRRVDENRLFWRKIGSPHARIELIEGEGNIPKEGVEVYNRLATLPEKSSVEDLLRRGGLGEYQTLRGLYRLIEVKRVTLSGAPEVEIPRDLQELFTAFARAFALLFRQIVAREPGFLFEMQTYLDELPEPHRFVVKGVQIDARGEVDRAIVLRNLTGLAPESQRRLLGDALNELLYRLCVRAREIFGSAESSDLVARVQEIGRRISLLAGRNES